MPVLIELFRLRIDNGTKPWHDTAFKDKGVAQLVAEELHQPYTTYQVMCGRGEDLGDGRCLIDDRVYGIDATTLKEKHMQRGLAKLTAVEKEALGLFSD